jgi:hypothetical protein
VNCKTRTEGRWKMKNTASVPDTELEIDGPEPKTREGLVQGFRSTGLDEEAVRAQLHCHTRTAEVDDGFRFCYKEPPPGRLLSAHHTPRQCAGESAETSQCYKREPRDRGKDPPGSGSPMMRPKTLPDSKSHTGKTPRSLTTNHNPSRDTHRQGLR